MKHLINYNAIVQENYTKYTLNHAKVIIKYFFLAPIYRLIYLLAHQKATKKRYNVSITAIFRNEGEFLREWITYHQLIGIEHFYLYNNNSDDDSVQVLAPFIAEGSVTLIDFPEPYAQVKAYKHSLKHHAHESSWIAFIDIDEFICLKRHDKIGQWIASYSRYASVILDWKIFGTSNIKQRTPNSLIIDQFTHSWRSCVNLGKSIVNTAYTFDRGEFVHKFHARRHGLTYPPVDEFKNPIAHGVHPCRILRGESTAQLNHYWSRSLEDYEYKIIGRGDVFSANAYETRCQRIWDLFERHEAMCTSIDNTIRRHTKELKQKMGI